MAEKEITINEALQIGIHKQNSGNFSGAEIIYKNILDKIPENIDALHLLGLIKYQEGKNKEAIELIEKAISIRGDIAIFHGNLGMVYDSIGDENKSIKEFETALKIDSNYEGAWRADYNLGVYYSSIGEIEKAIDYYDKCIERNLGFKDAKWNKALALLLLGKYKEGFENYDSRFEKEKPIDSRVFGNPKWNGENLQEKKILVITEQGAGDNFQFIRYLKLLKEKYVDCKIILECQSEIKNLFSNLKEIDEIINKDRGKIPDIGFDYYIHLMSLPKILGITLENIPYKEKYLFIDKNKVNQFKEHFNKNKLNIGIVWAGNPEQENDKNRSMKFEDIKELGKIKGIQLYSLQKGKVVDEVDFTNTGIIDLSHEIKDYEDTAGIIENLDLIISVDTSVAHLSGALGKETWTLLTKIPDWRYLLEGEKSIWYDSMKLFRQKERGNWKSVIENVKRELGKIIKTC